MRMPPKFGQRSIIIADTITVVKTKDNIIIVTTSVDNAPTTVITPCRMPPHGDAHTCTLSTQAQQGMISWRVKFNIFQFLTMFFVTALKKTIDVSCGARSAKTTRVYLISIIKTKHLRWLGRRKKWTKVFLLRWTDRTERAESDGLRYTWLMAGVWLLRTYDDKIDR